MNAGWVQLDSTIVGFFNPLAADPAVRPAVRNGWPLQRVDLALYVAMSYLTFVVGCKLLLDRGEKKAAQEKKGKMSVAEKIQREGILMFGAMALYNMTQVLLCAWMVYASITEHRRRGLSLVCNPHLLSEDNMAFVLHVFYLSKVLDFVDTFFMIVKGNWRQVSFLHVYHHFSIFLFYWLNAQAGMDGDIYLTIVLNGSVHTIMYGYYFLTAFNVQVPVFVKKSITNGQLFQFCCMEAQGAYLLWNGSACGYPPNLTVAYMLYISTMLILFMNFRTQTKNFDGRAAGKKAQ